jgi:quinol-cytochrome oxidoreductase complex cytochrome b subunit
MSAPATQGPLVKWIDERLPIFTLMRAELQDYPTPKNLNYWWNFGSIAGVMLVVLIATGVWLAMFYIPHGDLAFDSVERIMRDVNYGWLLRYLHSNGGSLFFIAVYIHLFRGIYYGSHKPPRELLWGLGVVLLGLMIATGFTGYVLVWGQMSFWAATVITNLFSVVPIWGDEIVTWILGGYAVDTPTLNRFYSFHYLLPFLIFAVVFLHLVALHTTKSGNPVGIEVKGPQDTIPFHPYYTVKDFFGFGAFFVLFLGFVFFAPNFFAEPDNYIPANPMVTPAEIVPEWYFLFYYAVLRAFDFDIFFVTAKSLGVISMFASIFILFLLPWLDRSPVRSGRFRPYFKQFFWLLVIDCAILTYVGGHSPSAQVFEWWEGFLFVDLAQITTAYYFGFFLVILPLLGWLEKPKPLPESISAAVTESGGSGG